MSTPLPYNPVTITDPGIPVSPLSIKSLLNWNPRLCAHVMLWFDPASTSHLNIGYNSSDPARVAQQVAYGKSRGVDFFVLEWYGTDAVGGNNAALAWKAECEKQNVNFCIGLDGGMFKPWNMGNSITANAYLTKQLQYVEQTFYPSPNYEKTADGRYLHIEFGWELVNGLTPATVMAQFPKSAVLWEHSSGVGRPASAGAFAWVGVSSDTQHGVTNYASNYIAAVAKAHAGNTKLLIMGSLVKGFDDHGRRPHLDPTKSCWDQTQAYRFADERQGQTLLDVAAVYNASPFKPDYMQIVTLTDHEEGTALEWGVDSQVTISLTTSSKGLVEAALTGNLNTVDHVELWVNGSLQEPNMAAAPALAFDLNTLNPTSGQQFSCYAVAVGKPLFQQKTSNTVTSTAVFVSARTVQLPVDVVVNVALPPTVAAPLPSTVNAPLPAIVTAQLPASVDAPLPPSADISLNVPATSQIVPIVGSGNGLAVSGSLSIDVAPQPVTVTVPLPPTASVAPTAPTVQVPPAQPTVVVAPAQPTVQVAPSTSTVPVEIKTTVTIHVNDQTVWQ